MLYTFSMCSEAHVAIIPIKFQTTSKRIQNLQSFNYYIYLCLSMYIEIKEIRLNCILYYNITWKCLSTTVYILIVGQMFQYRVQNRPDRN